MRTYVHTKTVHRNFIHESQKQNKNQNSTNRWMVNKLCYLYNRIVLHRNKLLINAPMCMNVKNTELSERSLTEKSTYHMILYEVWKDTKAIYSGRNKVNGFLEGLAAKGYRRTFCDDENVLYFDWGGSYGLYIYGTVLLECMHLLYVNYLTKLVFKTLSV